MSTHSDTLFLTITIDHITDIIYHTYSQVYYIIIIIIIIIERGREGGREREMLYIL